MTRLMVDLCSGLGGASGAFVQAGWRVITVDIEPKFHPTIVGDVRLLKGADITPERPTLVWASPPCIDFSRESMPWCRTGIAPSVTLVQNCLRLINELSPRYWVIENVRGAQRWLSALVGKRAKHVGPFYLWGEFPIFTCELRMRNKMAYSGDQDAERAQIPEKLSKALLRAIEAEL